MNIAYLILEKQTLVEEDYIKNRIGENIIYQSYFSKYRKYFNNIEIKKYKGISRNALQAVPKKFRNEFILKEPKAQFQMYKILNKQIKANTEENDDMLLRLSDCIMVFSKIINKNDFEIIKTIKKEFSTTYEKYETFLGYDIGYFGGDHYSIISDSLLLPTWHGPPEDAYCELKDYSKKLNENILFNNLSDAQEFRDFYLKQEWSEKEMYDGEICIQKIIEIERAHFT